MSTSKIGVFRAIVNGVEQRGDDGFLYVKGESCAYMKLGELENMDFKAALTEIISNDDGEHFFVATETSGQVDIMAYKKERVYENVKQDELSKLQRMSAA